MIEYPRKVLLATDGTPDSSKAARAAVAIAGRAGTDLHIVYVWHAAGVSGSGAAVGHPSYLPSEPPGYAERQARKLLQQRTEEIQAAGGTVTEAHLRTGRPAHEIVALAARLGADLLVVGSGGPHAMRRAVARTTRQAALGSVSDAIVRAAHCPVLVARGDEISQGAALGEGRADAKEGGK